MDTTATRHLVHEITARPRARAATFLSLSQEDRVRVLRAVGRGLRRELCMGLADADLVQLLEFLDPDEATDLLQLFPKKRQKTLLSLLTERLREEIEVLGKFDPQTAGGLMTLDYIQVDEQDDIANVVKRFHDHERRTGRPPTIVIMRHGKPVGVFPGHKLAFVKPSEAAGKYAAKLLTIRHDASHGDVLDFFRHHPHDKIAVLNDIGQVLGIIYSDDVIRVLRERESASLYDFAGVDDEETVADPALRKVRFRYRWLIVNLGTAFLAAGTVSLFNDTIAKYVLLAAYMPIVAGMGGNAATQTLAVVVRGISLRQIDLASAMPTLRRELGAAFINGVINGVLVALIVLVFNHDVKLAIVLGSAMIVNLLVAGFFGTLVPLLMRRFGKDPATSATVLISTATDVLGFLVFLGLATIVLV